MSRTGHWQQCPSRSNTTKRVLSQSGLNRFLRWELDHATMPPQKTGLAGAEQENTPKGKHPSRKSSQINQPKCSGRESNPHTLQVAHFECAASTIPPPKQKNKRPTLHPQQEHGTLVQPPESHKEPMASSQWLFTASHGVRMLRESNPRTPLGIATLARWCIQPLCQASKMQEPPQRLRRLFPQTRRVS